MTSYTVVNENKALLILLKKYLGDILSIPVSKSEAHSQISLFMTSTSLRIMA